LLHPQRFSVSTLVYEDVFFLELVDALLCED
jgi:hypothetical protein